MDDARYPSRSHPFKSRPRAPFRDHQPPSRVGRRYADYYDAEEGEEEEQQNDADEPIEEDEEEDDVEEGGGYRRARDYEDDSSSESRGKRKRIDELAMGFEFVPRVPPASSKPSARVSPPDWSEDATFELPDAWGDRYPQNGRKSLRSGERSEAAKKVSLPSKFTGFDAQCRSRPDALKKKYNKEKASMAGHSKWDYSKRLDAFMSSTPPPRRRPHAFPSSSFYQNHCNGNDQTRDGPRNGDEEDDSSDGLPPKRVNATRGSDSSFKMLAESIQKFGEVYEKMENHNKQQMAELDRMRKEFQRDLEVQKRQILERAQAEIAKLREDEQGIGEDDEEDDDGDDGGSPDNLSGFISASFYLTAFV